MSDGFISITNLFGEERLMKAGGKILPLRSQHVKFFFDENFHWKDGTPITASEVAVRMGHFTTDQISALKSSYVDRLRNPCHLCKQNGMTGSCEHSEVTARKYWWFTTETKAGDK